MGSEETLTPEVEAKAPRSLPELKSELLRTLGMKTVLLLLLLLLVTIVTITIMAIQKHSPA